MLRLELSLYQLSYLWQGLRAEDVANAVLTTFRICRGCGIATREELEREFQKGRAGSSRDCSSSSSIASVRMIVLEGLYKFGAGL
ncbi:hypothetical protein BKA62DRAFT_38735 [Auriculariales sp. MPI-PUGE-AT-0066]|nr:hypothetical protein BKA62DRAFT_38735 [Auriculariales sp. MPI-PUGE-AT-0066]